eukprot:PITA_01105
MSEEVTAPKPKTSSTSTCAACKIQKKKCSQKCVLAPYFPQSNPHKFMLVHKVFGNGHVVKLLQNLPAEQRGDAVNSLVYEASQRCRDPVHGCVGIINDLQNKVAELQTQLAVRQAELANMSVQHANLLTLIPGCHEDSYPKLYSATPETSEDTNMSSPDTLALWEQFWK